MFQSFFAFKMMKKWFHEFKRNFHRTFLISVTEDKTNVHYFQVKFELCNLMKIKNVLSKLFNKYRKISSCEKIDYNVLEYGNIGVHNF